MSLQIKRTSIILLASYFIYRFYFSFVSNSIQQLLLFGIIGIYLVLNFPRLLNHFRHFGRNKTLFVSATLLYALMVVFSFLIPIVHGTQDFSYLKYQLRYVSYLLSYIVLVDLIRLHLKPENLKDEVIRIYTVVSRNYVIVSMLMLVVRPLRYFWQSIIRETERNINLVNNYDPYVTRWGWSGFSGFARTMQMTIAVAFILYLILKQIQKGEKISLSYLVTLVFLLIGNAFYGRVGLLTSIGIIGLVVLYLILSKGKVILGVGILGSLATVFAGMTIFKEFNPAIEKWYNWAMDPILGLLQTGTFGTKSSDILFDMYFIPDLRTFFVGDGYYTDPMSGEYYMSTDVGYIRPLLFYGIFFLIAGYLIPVILSYTLVRTDRMNISLTLLLLTVMFIFEIKGEVFAAFIPIMYMIFYAESMNEYDLRKQCLLSESRGKLWIETY